VKDVQGRMVCGGQHGGPVQGTVGVGSQIRGKEYFREAAGLRVVPDYIFCCHGILPAPSLLQYTPRDGGTIVIKLAPRARTSGIDDAHARPRGRQTLSGGIGNLELFTIR
jgi:hypothetical protein